MGVLLSGFFKVMVPLIMMLPGVIAYHLYWGEGAASGLSSMDLAYPQLVRDVLPGWAQGLFLAVLMGAVFSSFNSFLVCQSLVTTVFKQPYSGRIA